MPRSLLGLRTAVLNQVDMADSDFINETQLNYWINAELAELHDILVTAYEDYFVTKYNITLDGSEQYDLPEDFFKLLKCYYVAGTINYRLKKFNMNDLSGEKWTVGNEFMRYRLMGTKLYLEGVPASSGILTLYYVPQAEQLSADEDRVNIVVPVGWEDFIVSGVAARCLAREESDPSFFLQRKVYLRNHFIESGSNRDAGEPTQMIDSYDRFVDGVD